jgi:acyl carrier protein
VATDRVTTEDVARLIRKQLGAKLDEGTNLGPETELDPLGLSSLDQTEVFFAIEEHVGKELDPTAAAEVETIGELVEVVNRLLEQAGDGASANPEKEQTASWTSSTP